MTTLNRIFGRSRLALLVVGLAAPVAMLAHAPGLSTAAIRVAPGHIDARIRLHDPQGALAETSAAIVIEVDGVKLAPRHTSRRPVGGGARELRLEFERPAGSEQLRVTLPLLARLPRGHRSYVTIDDASGTRLAEATLSETTPTLTAALGPGV